MNERLTLMRQRIRAGEHKTLRQLQPVNLLEECQAENLSWPRRIARLVRKQCEAEQVVIGEDEKILFTRSLPCIPPVYSQAEWSNLTAGRTLHELGPVSNICADWELLLTQGLLGRWAVAEATRTANG